MRAPIIVGAPEAAVTARNKRNGDRHSFGYVMKADDYGKDEAAAGKDTRRCAGK